MVTIHVATWRVDWGENYLSARPKQTGFALVILALIVLLPVSGWGSPAPAKPNITYDSGTNFIGVNAGRFQSDPLTITFDGTFPSTPNITITPISSANPFVLESQLVFVASAVATNMVMSTGVQQMFPTNNLVTWTCVFCVSNKVDPVLAGGLIDAFNISLSMNLSSKVGVSTGCIFWVQGFDTSLNAWEDLGLTSQTPQVSCQTAGTPTGASGINATLIGDNFFIGNCASSQVCTMLLRVVGKTTSGTPTIGIDTAALNEFSSYAPQSWTIPTISPTRFTIVAFGSPNGGFSFSWTATICRNLKPNC